MPELTKTIRTSRFKAGQKWGSPLFSMELELREAELAGDEVEHGDQVRG
jgi:hypothetical protein